MKTHLQDLIESTAQYHYEGFRAKQLTALKEQSAAMAQVTSPYLRLGRDERLTFPASWPTEERVWAIRKMKERFEKHISSSYLFNIRSDASFLHSLI